MTDGPIRDPAQIRADCARKLKPIETGVMFTALLAALLDEDWTTPKIEELFITSDRCILARPTGEVTHKLFIGAEADLIRNIHGIAEVAGLDGDELGYLLGKVAEARDQNWCQFIFSCEGDAEDVRPTRCSIAWPSLPSTPRPRTVGQFATSRATPSIEFNRGTYGTSTTSRPALVRFRSNSLR